jgi:hypothetical protein
VTVAGVFLVAPYHGFRAIRAGLTTDTYIEAMHVVPSKKSYALAEAELEHDEEQKQAIEECAREPNVYHRLAASIAPEIYGHADIKKALMLLLVVRRHTDTGNNRLSLRGSRVRSSSWVLTRCQLIVVFVVLCSPGRCDAQLVGRPQDPWRHQRAADGRPRYVEVAWMLVLLPDSHAFVLSGAVG